MRAIIDTFKGVTVAESMVTIMSSLKDSDIPALERLADEVLAE